MAFTGFRFAGRPMDIHSSVFSRASARTTPIHFFPSLLDSNQPAPSGKCPIRTPPGPLGHVRRLREILAVAWSEEGSAPCDQSLSCTGSRADDCSAAPELVACCRPLSAGGFGEAGDRDCRPPLVLQRHRRGSRSPFRGAPAFPVPPAEASSTPFGATATQAIRSSTCAAEASQCLRLLVQFFFKRVTQHKSSSCRERPDRGLALVPRPCIDSAANCRTSNPGFGSRFQRGDLLLARASGPSLVSKLGGLRWREDADRRRAQFGGLARTREPGQRGLKGSSSGR